VISITTNDLAKEATAFAREVKATFPVIMDSKGDLFNKYSVAIIPANFLVDRSGKIIAMPESQQALSRTVAKAMK